MASSSSSLHYRHNKHDVFLSFKGKDTPGNFTSHLYSALSEKCIETFIGNDLNRGDEISQSLLDAVDASSIYIIFSESYASSSWCLRQLLQILDRKTNYGQIVVAVFYRVEPSHVRKQIGSFGDSFSKLEERFPDKIQTGEQHIFLDVAYFLKEEHRVRVLSFLDACGFIAGIGLPVLVNSSLITISQSNTITMHGSLRDMGREIKYPGECSPLWHHKDICEVLIVNMHHGKLKHHGVTSNPSFIPPLSMLVILNLSECESLKSLPAEIFHLEFLKKLNLFGCSKLKRLPEFSSAGKIEEIWLDGTAIEELPSSIGCLSRLLNLYLSDCKRLKSLPSSLSQLKSLKALNLHGCSNLQRLPDEFGNLEASNSTLYTKGTAAIGEVPSSIVRWNNNFYELSLDRSWGGDKQTGLSSSITLPLDGFRMTLTALYLNYCGIMELPESLGQLCSLVSLHLEKNNFERIPESIIQLSRLELLNLNYCERLQSLPKLPFNLQWFFAHHCTALSSISYKSSTELFDLSDNFKLDPNEVGIIIEDALQDIQLMAAAHWKHVREEGFFLEKRGHVMLPGNEIPKWFMFQSVGSSSIKLEMPPPLPGFFTNKISPVLGFAFSAIVAFGDHRVDYCDGWFEFFCEFEVKSKDCQPQHVLERCDIAVIRYVESDHLVLGYYLFGDEDLEGFRECNCVIQAVAVQFYFQDFASSESLESCGLKVKKCGFHLLYAPDSTEVEPYAAP